MLSKLFSKKSKLEKIFDKFAKQTYNAEIYKALCYDVLEEFENGNSELYIATNGDSSQSSDSEETYSITSSGMHEGKNTIWVFSSEKYLLEWSKGACPYINSTTQGVIKLAELNCFEQIIINQLVPISKPETGDLAGTRIKKGANITIGLPKDPLSPIILNHLIDELRDVNCVEAIYHYLMITQEDQDPTGSLVISFYINEGLSDDGEREVHSVLQNSFEKYQSIGLPSNLCFHFIKTAEKAEEIASINPAITVYQK